MLNKGLYKSIFPFLQTLIFVLQKRALYSGFLELYRFCLPLNKSRYAHWNFLSTKSPNNLSFQNYQNQWRQKLTKLHKPVGNDQLLYCDIAHFLMCPKSMLSLQANLVSKFFWLKIRPQLLVLFLWRLLCNNVEECYSYRLPFLHLTQLYKC